MKKINQKQYGKLPGTNNETGEKSLTRSVDMVERLKIALDEEATAISEFDDEKLKEQGDTIQGLLHELAGCLPSVNDVTAAESKTLRSLLKDIKLHREKNRRLLEEVLNNAGEDINKLSVGRQTLRAYKGLKPDKEELFIKKKC